MKGERTSVQVGNWRPRTSYSMLIRMTLNLGHKKFWSCRPLKSSQITQNKLCALKKMFILTLTRATQNFFVSTHRNFVNFELVFGCFCYLWGQSLWEMWLMLQSREKWCCFKGSYLFRPKLISVKCKFAENEKGKKMLLNQKHLFPKACILLIHKNIRQEPIHLLLIL